ncbi:hypothetical protein D9M70_84830 [compost metagenome]
MLRMTGEDEVGRRRQHFEAQPAQFADQLLAAVDHRAAGLLEVFLVLEGGHRTGQRQTIQRIGVEAVLHPLQRLDQVLVADRQADAQAGQRARLGQGLRHQQVGVAVHQADRGLAAEVDIGLVHQHHAVGVGLEQALDGLQRQQAAGRGVRVGEDDAAIGTLVVLDADLELFVQRQRLEIDAVQAAIDRVEAVGDVREQQRSVVLEQRVEGVRQHLVGTVADEHLARLDAVVVGHRLLQAVGVRVRVQAQVVGRRGADRLDDLRRRAIGVLVGIQLDQPGQFRLLARHVGHQVLDEGAPELAHRPSLLSKNR